MATIRFLAYMILAVIFWLCLKYFGNGSGFFMTVQGFCLWIFGLPSVITFILYLYDRMKEEMKQEVKREIKEEEEETD